MRTSKEKLVEELQFLCDSLQGETPKEPEMILEDLRLSTGWLARTAELVADAEYYLNVRRGETTAELYEARVAHVLSRLKEAGVEANRMSVSDGMPGGSGMPSARLVIVQKGAPSPTTATQGAYRETVRQP